MKKALLLTDCSVDLALTVNRWAANQVDAIDLTVVYAFALSQTDNQPLTAATHRAAKQEANANLGQWLNYLTTPWSGKIQTETLLGDPGLVIRIHLLLRQYDYLLIDLEQQEVASAFLACQNYTTTELHRLTVAEEVRLTTAQTETTQQWLRAA
ncbi:hypothetical protein [Spirosoma foliorum]|uniref:UspA domain-containing protein n=1 Tax=Spirosoma foliorum TaxID=2710596 RepID=A0A7G5GPT5_9BACT|nr:hypothetical protein [Spirosoma foliorum]QMW00877.1 hypothetical protein H3H32_23240 [Spirosoma foliorum]